VVSTNAQPTISSNTNAIAESAKPVTTNAQRNAKPVLANPTPTPAQAVVVSPQPNWTLIGGGAAALVALAGIIVFLVRKSATPKGPSFISQSMTRERLNRDASKPSSDNPADHE